MTSSETPTIESFSQLNLPEEILKTLVELGYETPSPIQAASIPVIQEGRDLLGQAQTGTGKTAAFALPLLAKIDPNKKYPQLLVLAPTRELAIQVAEAFQTYSRYLKCSVLPIYGGQSYDNQLRQLKRGTQIIVGTPGRVMDHIRRKTLKLDQLQALVLDEADEMLRMGFIDDVEWILEHTPKDRQIALFSATMPKEIKKVADKYLVNPKHIQIETKTSTAPTIRQRFSIVNRNQKLDAFTRILEVEDFDGVIVFVRTKVATIELAEKLSARGHSAAALNGDIAQNQRENIVDKLKKGTLDILVATDVVARGLDVKRISHVINYDIPLDTESYVHRIGRTGRAGRSGDAILFVTSRERHLLRAIERATNSIVEPMDVPSANDVNQKRAETFKQRINEAIAHKDLDIYHEIINQSIQENEHPIESIAAALAYLAQGSQPLFVSENDFQKQTEFSNERSRGDRKDNRNERPRRGTNDRSNNRSDSGSDNSPRRKKKEHNDANMNSYRIEIGREDGVKPGNIVGAIANEADMDSKFIGSIKISDNYSTVDLPKDMPKAVFKKLQGAYICGKQTNMKPVN
ncbi:MAG: ATP-dependent RNA helicase DeaD [Candidatus Endobugula sp.]|jgi:ATP-dependent RNA helicase DeaD